MTTMLFPYLSYHIINEGTTMAYGTVAGEKGEEEEHIVPNIPSGFCGLCSGSPGQ